jgi:hypothetical protein
VALLRPDSPIYEFVEPRGVARLVSEHQSRRRDHSWLMWRLLVLDLWISALRTGTLSRSTPMFAAAAA